ncbi:hypothetical protein [Pseudoxanthomonas sp. GM95]|uniref:hypothetical protein n=1 Tax=Pseudoxanthomonas sp. GM95 TaxID=1881043 RepID=UPI001587EE77|nr:hypothetical protein [Pseudoxanthomonas sp. GM95]
MRFLIPLPSYAHMSASGQALAPSIVNVLGVADLHRSARTAARIGRNRQGTRT